MRFSIQKEGEEKETYVSFREASVKTGISIPSIWNCLKKHPEGIKFMKLSNRKTYFIKEEKEEKLAVIDGEDFYSFGELKEKFNIAATRFLNQLVKKRKHFLDAEEISHQVSWISPEVEKYIDRVKHNEMVVKANKTVKMSDAQFGRNGTGK